MRTTDPAPTVTPAELGLPSKFVAFRQGQFDVALAAASADKRFVLLSSPTGSGKSLIYLAAARLTDARTLILTSTKGLQAQLLADFGPIGLTDIRGQNNYRCLAATADGELSEYAARPGLAPIMCDEGPCHFGVQCPLKRDAMGNGGGCAYEDAVLAARDANLVVTNYAYWLTTGRFADPDLLGKFDLLVLDEAHAAPDELADFCAVRLDREEISSLLGLTLPPLDEGVDAWSGWAGTALAECRMRYSSTRQELGAVGSDRRKTGRLLKRLTDLGRKLKELANAHDWRRTEPTDPNVWIPGMQTDWIAEQTQTGALFSPVWAHAYAESYLFRGVPKVVLVSAVLQRSVARYLGIDEDAFDYREFKSTFDPDRRPLIYVPTTTVDRRMTDGQVRVWLNRIDAIIGARLDRKGIIHTRSYERARIIESRSKYRGIMVTHTTRTTRSAVEQFKRAAAPCVLVSPSVEEGFDFAYDLCAYQILAKVPFVDMRSAIMQARVKSDRSYANYLTALSLIQQVGRGMRAEDDACENLIIDDHIIWFWRAAKKLFPAWFRAAWRTSAGLPPPLKLR